MIFLKQKCKKKRKKKKRKRKQRKGMIHDFGHWQFIKEKKKGSDIWRLSGIKNKSYFK